MNCIVLFEWQSMNMAFNKNSYWNLEMVKMVLTLCGTFINRSHRNNLYKRTEELESVKEMSLQKIVKSSSDKENKVELFEYLVSEICKNWHSK